MSTLPVSYASPLHLPFNRACLDGRLQLAAPGADPGGTGVWLAVQGGDLLVAAASTGLALPAGEQAIWGFAWYFLLTLMRGLQGPLIRLQLQKRSRQGERASILTL